MAPRIVDKQEKRMEIAHAAIAVFARQGFERTKMDEVAREAGVGKGTIYEYFADKDELLHGAFELMMATFMDQLSPALDDDTPPLDALKTVAYGTIDAMEHMAPVYKFFFEYMIHATRDQRAVETMADLLSRFRLLVGGLLQRAVASGDLRPDLDTTAAAAAFSAWFDGAIFHWIVMPDGPSLRQMADQYLELMLHGMLAKPSGGR